EPGIRCTYRPCCKCRHTLLARKRRQRFHRARSTGDHGARAILTKKGSLWREAFGIPVEVESGSHAPLGIRSADRRLRQRDCQTAFSAIVGRSEQAGAGGSNEQELKPAFGSEIHPSRLASDESQQFGPVGGASQL